MPPLSPVDSRAHSVCAAVVGSVRRMYPPMPWERGCPASCVSRMTALTPRTNSHRPSGATSHVRCAPGGRARRQKPVASSAGGFEMPADISGGAADPRFRYVWRAQVARLASDVPQDGGDQLRAVEQGAVVVVGALDLDHVRRAARRAGHRAAELG